MVVEGDVCLHLVVVDSDVVVTVIVANVEIVEIVENVVTPDQTVIVTFNPSYTSVGADCCRSRVWDFLGGSLD